MNKYTLQFDDKLLEDNYQLTQLKSIYITVLNCASSFIILLLLIKFIDGLVNNNQSQFALKIITLSVTIIQVLLVKKWPKFARYCLAIICVNQAFFQLDLRDDSVQHTYLVGSNQMGVISIIMLICDFREGTFLNLALVIVKLSIANTEVDYQDYIYSFLIFGVYQIIIYYKNQYLRNLYLLSLKDLQWDQLIPKIVQKPFFIFKYDDNTLSFEQIQSYKMDFLEQNNANELQYFIRQAKIENSTLENYIFRRIKSNRELKLNELLTSSLDIFFFKKNIKITFIECFFASHTFLIMLEETKDEDQKDNEKARKYKQKQYIQRFLYDSLLLLNKGIKKRQIQLLQNTKIALIEQIYQLQPQSFKTSHICLSQIIILLKRQFEFHHISYKPQNRCIIKTHKPLLIIFLLEILKNIDPETNSIIELNTMNNMQQIIIIGNLLYPTSSQFNYADRCLVKFYHRMQNGNYFLYLFSSYFYFKQKAYYSFHELINLQYQQEFIIIFFSKKILIQIHIISKYDQNIRKNQMNLSKKKLQTMLFLFCQFLIIFHLLIFISQTLMMKYSLQFNDTLLESNFQSTQMRNIYYQVFKWQSIGTFLFFSMKFIDGIINDNQSQFVMKIVTLGFTVLQMIIVRKWPQIAGICLMLSCINLSLLQIGISNDKTQRVYLLGANQSCIISLMILLLDYKEGTVTHIIQTIIKTFFSWSDSDYQDYIFTLLVFIVYQICLYIKNKYLRNLYLLSLKELQWDQLISIAISKPLFIFRFDIENLMFVELKQHNINFIEPYITNQLQYFLRSSQINNGSLESYLYKHHQLGNKKYTQVQEVKLEVMFEKNKLSLSLIEYFYDTHTYLIKIDQQDNQEKQIKIQQVEKSRRLVQKFLYDSLQLLSKGINKRNINLLQNTKIMLVEQIFTIAHKQKLTQNICLYMLLLSIKRQFEFSYVKIINENPFLIKTQKSLMIIFLLEIFRNIGSYGAIELNKFHRFKQLTVVGEFIYPCSKQFQHTSQILVRNYNKPDHKSIMFHLQLSSHFHIPFTAFNTFWMKLRIMLNFQFNNVQEQKLINYLESHLCNVTLELWLFLILGLSQCSLNQGPQCKYEYTQIGNNYILQIYKALQFINLITFIYLYSLTTLMQNPSQNSVFSILRFYFQLHTYQEMCFSDLFKQIKIQLKIYRSEELVTPNACKRQRWLQ